MKKSILLALVVLLAACQKDPGTGGLASISGKIEKEYRVVITNPATAQHQVPAANEDVYIVYGDHVSPDDKVVTDYDGNFSFEGLRPGKYTVYVYSKDTTAAWIVDPNLMVVKQEVEIGKKKESKDIGTLQIYDVP
jgi:hypothetical protein